MHFSIVQPGRMEVVPKGREIVAGGGAKRNHRISITSKGQAPEGRQKRGRRSSLAPAGAKSLVGNEFRWFRFAPPPATFFDASGVGLRGGPPTNSPTARPQ